MLFGAALLCGYSLCAVMVGPDWCVVYPDSQKKVVNRALKVAAEEVAGDINEATGLKIKALPASKASLLRAPTRRRGNRSPTIACPHGTRS